MACDKKFKITGSLRVRTCNKCRKHRRITPETKLKIKKYEQTEARRQAHKRYEQSAKGKLTSKRYRESAKGKATRARYMHSTKVRERLKILRRTPEQREYQRKYQRQYRAVKRGVLL